MQDSTNYYQESIVRENTLTMRLIFVLAELLSSTFGYGYYEAGIPSSSTIGSIIMVVLCLAILLMLILPMIALCLLPLPKSKKLL